MGRAITWDEPVHTYGPIQNFPSVLGIFISCFLMLDRGQHVIQMLQLMLEAPNQYEWG